MGNRTRNILIGVMALFAVMGVGSALILPYLNPEMDPGGPGVAEHARGRRLMAEGKFDEAQGVLLDVIQRYRGTAVASRAQADRDYGIPYHQGLRSAQGGQTAQAILTLTRVARDGAGTEWGPKATEELNTLGQPAAATARPGPAEPAPASGAPPGAGQAPPAGQDASRQARLEQANALLDQGRTEEARRIFQGLVEEGANDPAGTAAHLALTTLQVADEAVRSSPQVTRARVALHRARASLLAYRGANGRYPATLQDPGLERFGFSYPDLLDDVRRVESYRPEGADRFEITAVARDAPGTRVRATERAVEDLP